MRMTSMTPMTIASETTRPRPMKSMMSKRWSPSWTTWPTIPLIWSKTPMPARIVHSTKTMTTPAIPKATESRNETFIADHGSTRETVRRTRRGAGRTDAGRALLLDMASGRAGVVGAAPAAGAAAEPRPACRAVSVAAGVGAAGVGATGGGATGAAATGAVVRGVTAGAGAGGGGIAAAALREAGRAGGTRNRAVGGTLAGA